MTASASPPAWKCCATTPDQATRPERSSPAASRHRLPTRPERHPNAPESQWTGGVFVDRPHRARGPLNRLAPSALSRTFRTAPWNRPPPSGSGFRAARSGQLHQVQASEGRDPRSSLELAVDERQPGKPSAPCPSPMAMGPPPARHQQGGINTAAPTGQHRPCPIASLIPLRAPESMGSDAAVLAVQGARPSRATFTPGERPALSGPGSGAPGPKRTGLPDAAAAEAPSEPARADGQPDLSSQQGPEDPARERLQRHWAPRVGMP